MANDELLKDERIWCRVSEGADVLQERLLGE